MTHAALFLDPAFRIAPVRRRTFGSFLEHLGRAVYGGIYEPGHPSADVDGFRGDVAALVRELGVSTVRYPGGNFVSGYRWEDGIGPVENRPTRLDLAWHSTEPNTVGVDEFVRWCRLATVEPMMALNLGTRGVREALDLLEYCNIPGGTAWSERRRSNGAADPYGIRMWCLGNEMDGPWQTGHKTAAEYGRLAAETARAMRQMQPDVQLVACGSSGSGMPTFGEWERVVLTECYDQVDFISAHAYYRETDGDLASFLTSAVDMDRFVDSITATADAVRAAGRHSKHINISFDEWNVWYIDAATSQPPTDSWPLAPALLEDRYSVADAVVVGNLLISLLRHSDRVHAASLAQLVNVIAPIMTEPGGRAWKQTIFHPFALTSRYAAGDVLDVRLDTPTQDTATFGAAPLVDSVATWDESARQIAIFAVNRSVDQAVAVAAALGAFPGARVLEALTLANDDPYATASAQDDTSLAPRPNASAEVAGGALTVVLPPVSWSVIRLAVG